MATISETGSDPSASPGHVIEAINAIDPKMPRIVGLLDRFYDSPVQICPARSHLATESWKETEGQPLHLRRAYLFAKVCDEIPITIFDRELIVGSQTPFPRGVGLQLDFSPQMGLEIEAGDRRLRADQTEGLLTDADLKTIVDDAHYWQGRSPGDVMLQEIRAVMGSRYEDVSVDVCTRSHGKQSLSSPHPDYDKLLRVGLCGIIAEIDHEIQKIQFSSPRDGDKYLFLRAAKLGCEAQIRLARRYAQLARQMAAQEANDVRKKELETIAEICEQVPENPPRNFWEALQSIRFIHLGLYLEEGNGSGIPLGRLDQYLYPFFHDDLELGKLTIEQAAELLSAFWIKMASTDAFVVAGVKISGAGYLNTRTTLGGVDRSGNDASNSLTYLILHIAGHLKLGVPIYLRWHSGTRRELMLKAVETNMQIGSEPAFHNDEHIIPGLVADGVSLEDARDYLVDGCAHPYPYGSIYGTYHFIDGAKVFELVMYNGHDPRTGKQLGIQTGDPVEFESIEDWIGAFQKQWEYVYDTVLKGFKIGELVKMQVYSQPFASALSPDCIQKGQDVHAGGVRYPQFTGDVYNKIYADVVDSLVAINEWIYRKRTLSVSELIQVCMSDFAGERGEVIRRMLESAPKFGNDLGKPEETYRILNDYAATWGRSRRGQFGYPKRDVKLGGAVHGSHGRIVGALPSGRKAGMPLADGGISPCAGVDTQGPTVTMRSVAKSLAYEGNRTAVLNMKMPKSLLRTRTERERLVDLIESYFVGYNGYQVQWNIQDREFYLAAKAHPSEYKNLIVRVGGYSAYFVELDSLLQDQIIARTEQRICC
ncbi:MAG: hypothetical protein M1132_12860 [Chloroflexi bacterium]|nr:hypothetical protein [Chloroflexota bacterium]